MVCNQSSCDCSGWVPQRWNTKKCLTCTHSDDNHSDASNDGKAVGSTRKPLTHSLSAGDIQQIQDQAPVGLKKRGVSPAPHKDAPPRPPSTPLSKRDSTSPASPSSVSSFPASPAPASPAPASPAPASPASPASATFAASPTSPASPGSGKRELAQAPPGGASFLPISPPREPPPRPSKLVTSSPAEGPPSPMSPPRPTPPVKAAPSTPLYKSTSFTALPDGPSKPPPMRPNAANSSGSGMAPRSFPDPISRPRSQHEVLEAPNTLSRIPPPMSRALTMPVQDSNTSTSALTLRPAAASPQHRQLPSPISPNSPESSSKSMPSAIPRPGSPPLPVQSAVVESTASPSLLKSPSRALSPRASGSQIISPVRPASPVLTANPVSPVRKASRLVPSAIETRKQTLQTDDAKDWVEFFDSSGQSLFVNMVNRGTFMEEDLRSIKQAQRARADSRLFRETWTNAQEDEEKVIAARKQAAFAKFIAEEDEDEDSSLDISLEKLNTILLKMQNRLSTILTAPLYDEQKLPLERGRSILEDNLLLSAPRDITERSLKRKAVLINIITLETSFIEQAQMLVELFFDPLTLTTSIKTYGAIVQEPKISVLSNLLKNLKELHVKLYAELKNRLDHWTPTQTLGDLLSVWGNQYFRLHAQYARDYSEIRMKMERCAMANAAFGHHFKNAKFSHTSAESLLDSPSFHIARLVTLLKRLLRITDRTHNDYNDIEKAYFAALSAQENVDEASWASSQSNKESLALLAQQFDTTLNLSNFPRKLIKEGRLCMLVPKFGPKFFYFHLLSDCLLYSSILEEQQRQGGGGGGERGATLSFVRSLEVSQLTLKRLPSEPLSSSQSTRNLNEELMTSAVNPKTSFSLLYHDEDIIIQTRNQHDKRGWVSVLRKATEMAKVTGAKSAPAIVAQNNSNGNSSSAAKKCMVCSKEFSMTRRKGHCRACGKLVCGTCTTTKTTTNVSSKSIRVCKPCASSSSELLTATASGIVPVDGGEWSDEDVLSEEDDKSAHRSSSKSPRAGGGTAAAAATAAGGIERSASPVPQGSVRDLSVPTKSFVNVSNPVHIKLCNSDPHYALVHELIANETEYVSDLELLIAFVVKPMLAAPELTPKSKGATAHTRNASNLAETLKLVEEELIELRQLLNLVQPMHAHNLGVLTKLADKASPSNWGPSATANDLIVSAAAGFGLYSSYSQAHWKVDQILNNKLASLLTNYDRLLRDKTTKEKSYTARFLLRLPTLRLAQYIFYFQQLISLSAPGQSTYGPSLAMMQKNNSSVANSTSSKERLVKLESRFAGGKVALAKDGRVLVKEGILSRMTRRGVRSFYFHLLSDLLLYSDVLKTGTYNLHHSFELHSVAITEPIGCPHPYAIQFSSPQKSFLMICDVKEDKIAWETALQKCIVDSKKNSGGKDNTNLAPLWTQDQHSTCCVLCQSVFTAIKRRHHCRSCGILVCNACSKTKQLLPSVDKKPVRVCDSCTHLHSGIK